jgi:hypothetical protein
MILFNPGQFTAGAILPPLAHFIRFDCMTVENPRQCGLL